jgi:hypothetical protein
MTSSVFESAQAKDDEITARITQARERALAYPEDHDAQKAWGKVAMDGKKMWDACIAELKTLDQASTDDDERTMLVGEINLARSFSEAYMEEASKAVRAASRTTKLGKFGESMTSAGNAMQGAGKSMQSAGHTMTSGCTIPIIIAIILLLLFIIL